MKTGFPQFAISTGALLLISVNSAWSQSSRPSTGSKQLPITQIENIVNVKGTVTNGVLDLSISRRDIDNVQGPIGVTFTPAFVFTPAKTIEL